MAFSAALGQTPSVAPAAFRIPPGGGVSLIDKVSLTGMTGLIGPEQIFGTSGYRWQACTEFLQVRAFLIPESRCGFDPARLCVYTKRFARLFPVCLRMPSTMAVPPHHFDDDPSDAEPGGLLGELERRQDDVLSQLDDLDAKLAEVLKGLEPASDTEDGDSIPKEMYDLLDFDDLPESNPSEQELPASESDAEPELEGDDDCAEDWA